MARGGALVANAKKTRRAGDDPLAYVWLEGVRQRDFRLKRIDPARGFFKAQMRRVLLGLIGFLGEAL